MVAPSPNRFVDHLYFANVESVASPTKRSGYQIYRSSVQITQQLEAELGARLSGSVESGFRHVFFHLSDGRFAVSKVSSDPTPDGQGRYGKIFAHTILLSEDELEQFDFDPFAIFEMPVWSSFHTAVFGGGVIPEFDLSRLSLPAAPTDRHACLDNTVGPAFSLALVSTNTSVQPRLFVSGAESLVYAFLDGVFRVLTPGLRRNSSFDTSREEGLDTRGFWALGTSGSRSDNRNISSYSCDDRKWTMADVALSEDQKRAISIASLKIYNCREARDHVDRILGIRSTSLSVIVDSKYVRDLVAQNRSAAIELMREAFYDTSLPRHVTTEIEAHADFSRLIDEIRQSPSKPVSESIDQLAGQALTLRLMSPIRWRLRSEDLALTLEVAEDHRWSRAIVLLLISAGEVERAIERLDSKTNATAQWLVQSILSRSGGQVSRRFEREGSQFTWSYSLQIGDANEMDGQILALLSGVAADEIGRLGRKMFNLGQRRSEPLRDKFDAAVEQIANSREQK